MAQKSLCHGKGSSERQQSDRFWLPIRLNHQVPNNGLVMVLSLPTWKLTLSKTTASSTNIAIFGMGPRVFANAWWAWHIHFRVSMGHSQSGWTILISYIQERKMLFLFAALQFRIPCLILRSAESIKQFGQYVYEAWWWKYQSIVFRYHSNSFQHFCKLRA